MRTQGEKDKQYTFPEQTNIVDVLGNLCKEAINLVPLCIVLQVIKTDHIVLHYAVFYLAVQQIVTLQ